MSAQDFHSRIESEAKEIVERVARIARRHGVPRNVPFGSRKPVPDPNELLATADGPELLELGRRWAALVTAASKGWEEPKRPPRLRADVPRAPVTTSIGARGHAPLPQLDDYSSERTGRGA